MFFLLCLIYFHRIHSPYGLDDSIEYYVYTGGQGLDAIQPNQQVEIQFALKDLKQPFQIQKASAS